MPSLRARCSQLCLNATYLSALCLVLVLCVVPARLFAQGTGGRILGRITDPSGAVLSGAKVTATNDATGVGHDANANDSGDYAFPDLPVGTYSLTFDLTGFKKSIRHGIALDVNQVITLNMTMQLGATQEVVDVTSEAPLVDTSSTQLGAAGSWIPLHLVLACLHRLPRQGLPDLPIAECLLSNANASRDWRP